VSLRREAGLQSETVTELAESARTLSEGRTRKSARSMVLLSRAKKGLVIQRIVSKKERLRRRSFLTAAP
jgi:hypothetical protein